MASIEGFGWILKDWVKGNLEGGRNEDEGYDYGVGWNWCRAWLGDTCDIMSKSNEENYPLAPCALYNIYLIILFKLVYDKRKNEHTI